jgi:acyl-CoA synthetase (AMP-forming)/AMP-acid ligase II
MHAGCCVNPVNLLSQPEQMRHVLAHSDCQVVFVASDWEARVRALLATIDRKVGVIVPDADADADALPGDRGADETAPDSTSLSMRDDLALLMYTSGTTGVPKGVMLTQANLVANAQAISAEHGLAATDRVLAVLPLYHINAFAVTMLAPLAHGGSLAMPPRFSAARFWQQAADSGCNLDQCRADDDLVPARRTGAGARADGAAALLPLGLGRAAARAPAGVRAALRDRHHRDDGADRDGRAGVLEPSRS